MKFKYRKFPTKKEEWRDIQGFALMAKLHPKDNELIVSNAQPHRTETKTTAAE